MEDVGSRKAGCKEEDDKKEAARGWKSPGQPPKTKTNCYETFKTTYEKREN
jgi:hypothetical protein